MPNAATPDARFNEFLIIQAQNAGLFLGQIAHPHTGEKSINLRAAKSVMDSLEMLAVKTSGNLTETEAKLLDLAISKLSPIYQNALQSADNQPSIPTDSNDDLDSELDSESP